MPLIKAKETCHWLRRRHTDSNTVPSLKWVPWIYGLTVLEGQVSAFCHYHLTFLLLHFVRANSKLTTKSKLRHFQEHSQNTLWTLIMKILSSMKFPWRPISSEASLFHSLLGMIALDSILINTVVSLTFYYSVKYSHLYIYLSTCNPLSPLFLHLSF